MALVSGGMADDMKYVTDGRVIRAGDSVLVEGNVAGVVVCDLDQWQCLSGYEGWLSKAEVIGDASLLGGVLIDTSEIGMIHYSEPDDEIVFLASMYADDPPELK